MTAFRLRVEKADDSLLLRESEKQPRLGRDSRRSEKHLAYVLIECYAADYDPLCRQVLAAGGASAPARAGGRHVVPKSGSEPIQLIVAPKSMPNNKSKMGDMNIPPNVRGVLARSAGQHPSPPRLSHIALFTSDVTRSVDLYTRALGVRLACRSGDIIAFYLRAAWVSSIFVLMCVSHQAHSHALKEILATTARGPEMPAAVQ